MKTFLLIAILAFSTTAIAQTSPSNDQVDAAALADLQKFLFDDVARRTYAAKKPDAAAANNYLESFPAWAQQELLDIVMMIMTESKGGATKHVDAYKGPGDAMAAKNSFSPAVKQKIDALVNKLNADKSFNNPNNLQQMQQKMPMQGTTPRS